MPLEIGTATDCPQCRGLKKIGTRQCPVCHGEGRVEYQERDGHFTAPAGSFLPARRRGGTGYMVVLFGPPKQEMRR